MDFAQGRAAFNRLLLELPGKSPTTSTLEKDVHPSVREDIHQVHPTCIRDVDWCDPSKEQGSDERRDERYGGRALVCGGVCAPDLVHGFHNQQHENHRRGTLTFLICGPVNLS
jgi:hypothetical protein